MPAMPSLPTRDELRALLTLAVPVVVVQVGMMMMGVVDTIMVGHLNAEALASVALGNLYFFGVAIFGMGVMVGPTLGPTLGGWITDNYAWPWIFYINIPLGILAATGRTSPTAATTGHFTRRPTRTSTRTAWCRPTGRRTRCWPS